MLEDNLSHAYDDIIELKNPTSRKHPRMSAYDRAAQFSPFAALTGHDAAIQETARLTQSRIELDEESLSVLNERLNIIGENLETNPIVSITYFVPDSKKSGGAYITKSGRVRKIDEFNHVVIFTDKTLVPIAEITEIKCELFSKKSSE